MDEHLADEQSEGEKPYRHTVIARRDGQVTGQLIRDADLVIVGDHVVKDRYDLRRQVTEAEITELISQSRVVTRL